MIFGVYTCTTLNLCRKYFSTLNSHNLILTTFVKLNFRVLHHYNLKSLPTIYYIFTTWFQGFTFCKTSDAVFQKCPKSYSENMQQVYRRKPCKNTYQSNFFEMRLQHRCSPVNLQHISRTPFPKNTYRELLLQPETFIFIHGYTIRTTL